MKGGVFYLYKPYFFQMDFSSEDCNDWGKQSYYLYSYPGSYLHVLMWEILTWARVFIPFTKINNRNKPSPEKGYFKFPYKKLEIQM